MATLDDWTQRACQALSLEPEFAAEHQRLVLELARDVAHGVVRPAAPIAAFLLGVAVGRGADPVQAAGILTGLPAEPRQS